MAAAEPTRRYTGLLVTVVAGLVLLCIGGGAVGAVLVMRNPRGSSATAHPSTSYRRTTIATPDRIGTLFKSANQSQAAADRAQVSGEHIVQVALVQYQDDSGPEHLVGVSGIVVDGIAAGSLADRLDRVFVVTARKVDGRVEPSRSTLQTGRLGGLAACDEVTGKAVTYTVCGWVGDDATAIFVFRGFSAVDARLRFAEILPIVVRN